MKRFTFNSNDESNTSKEEVKETKVVNPYNVGKLLDSKKAIMNYIYDEVGFRIGVVVATAEEGKCHPSIGWALFDEVETICHNIKTIGDVPLFANLMDAPVLDDSEIAINHYLLKNFPIDKVPKYYYDLNRENRYKLIKLALDRRNHNAWDFYTPEDLVGADVRNNFIATTYEYTGKYGVERECNPIWYDESVCKAIRRQVRDMEYRVYRYFK